MPGARQRKHDAARQIRAGQADVIRAAFVVDVVEEGVVENSEDREVVLAKCLTRNGVKLYAAEWCSHCKKQKEAFMKQRRYLRKNKPYQSAFKETAPRRITEEMYPGQSIEKDYARRVASSKIW